MFDSKKTVFKAKRTHLTLSKLFSKGSEHNIWKENYFRSEANTLDRKENILEAKRTRPSVSKLFSKRSEHIR